MKDRKFQTYKGWRAACRKEYTGVKFEGNKDICQAFVMSDCDENDTERIPNHSFSYDFEYDYAAIGNNNTSCEFCGLTPQQATINFGEWDGVEGIIYGDKEPKETWKPLK